MSEAIRMIYEETPAVLWVLAFIFGTLIGSFLNVCIYRFPKHESIVIVPSHCMSCGKQLKWYELVPLFSYIFLGGKCSGCKAKISPQYAIVEGTTGLIFLGILFIKGICPDTLLIQLMAASLLVITVVDARTMEIPFPCVVTIGILGVIRWVWQLSAFKADWLNIVLGPVIMAVLFLAIILFSGGRAMGGGDFKLSVAAGIFLGAKGVGLGLALGCLVGSVIHLFLMAIKKKGRELAFGPYLSIGFLVSALWGNEIISWYIAKFFTM